MSVEVIKGLERKAKFTVKKSSIDPLVEEELKKYAKKAKTQGFRPGKVPANVVKQMYGGTAYEEVLNKQINKNFADFVVANKLELAGYPKIDLENSEGEDFVFAAIFEVMPTVKLGDLTKQEVNRFTCEIGEDQVQKTIDALLLQRASYTKSDKACMNNDKVTIDFNGTINGTPFEGGSATDYPFVLGQKLMLPEFEAGILGLKAGESCNVNVTFPDNYHGEDVKGKTAIFAITVKQVEEAVLPELTEEFITSIGVKGGTADALKTEISNNLKHEVAHRLKTKQREATLKALSDASPLDVPHTLVHDEIHHMMDSTKENMTKQGYKPEQIKLTHEMFDHDAKRFVTLRFLVQEYIKENNINITDDEIKATVADMASLYEDKDEYIKWYYADQTRVHNARGITLENKVIDSIMTKVKLKDLPVSYDELMRN